MKNEPTERQIENAPCVLIIGSFASSLVLFRGNLIRDLVGLGYRVAVAAPDIRSDLRVQLTNMGAEIHETPLERTGTSILADLKYLRRLIALLRQVKPDVLLTYTIKPNIWGAIAADRTAVRSIAMVTGLGYAFTDTGVKPSLRQSLARFFARRLYRAATRRNYRVIFQNPDDRNDFIAAGCLTDREKAYLVSGSGVDMAHYARAPLPDAPIVLMIARLLRNKGVREYAQAMASLKTRFPEARFQLVGPFDHGPDSILQSDLDEWVANGLEYIGPLDDVRPAIATTRIYVLPSYREGTPRSVLEAMAMGRPIITTDVPGCRETVEDGINGLLVPVRDAEALANAIGRLLANPDEATAMGDASFDRAAMKYDVRLVNESLISAMNLPPAPPRSATPFLVSSN